MKSLIILLMGILYVALLFIWRFRCMKGKNPNTDLLILAWKSFSSPNITGKEEDK
jgi:hypothetical protein